MLPLLTLLALAQAPSPPLVAVVDVSAPDAVYEDVSRAMADEVVAELKKAGLESVRITENELPEGGCHLGPCLGDAARAAHARIVVALEATELDKKRTGVSLAALAARDGRMISARRYIMGETKPAPAPKKKKKKGKQPERTELELFVADVAKEAQRIADALDAGAQRRAPQAADGGS